MRHLTTAELEAGIDRIRGAPGDRGRIEMIVRRPAVDLREVLIQADLDTVEGLVGDTWRQRGSSKTVDGSANLEAQITVMNARAAGLVAGERDRWQLAGDQLYVDFDIGIVNLPAGTRLALGSAVIEISATPHTGCVKFLDRFGKDALRFVNSPAGKELRLRGANARVIVAGTVRAGDSVRRVSGGVPVDELTAPDAAPAA